jgi:PKD repeat protein
VGAGGQGFALTRLRGTDQPKGGEPIKKKFFVTAAIASALAAVLTSAPTALAGLPQRSGGRAMSRLNWIAVVASVATLFVPEAQAVVVQAAPTFPVANAVAAPPPIPALPAAGNATPPSDQIADPVTPAPGCSLWYQQSKYGDRWAAGSSWWEYRCTYESTFYSNPCTTGACEAFCWYCYWETQDWTDYFYWDGANAVFYGEAYSDSIVWEGGIAPDSSSTDWWDAPTAQWYYIAPPPNVAPTASFTFSCAGLTCALDGTVSSDSDGTIADYSWTFGDGSSGSGANASHAYSSAGTYDVALTVTDSGGATGTVTKPVTVVGPTVAPTASFTFSCTGLSCSFDGSGSTDSDGTIASYSWGFGDGAASSGVTATHTYGHSGTYSVSLTVTDDRGRSSTASKDVAVTNLAPTAAFTVTCTSLRCTFDASGSADRDGTIATYAWNFGDETTGTVTTKSTAHDYPKAANYTVTLTVTDNAGGSAPASQRINPISLSARGSKQGGQQKVDLSWNGVTGASYDVYRNGAKIVTVSTTAYTDTVAKGTGTYKYRVCDPAGTTCSNESTVSF